MKKLYVLLCLMILWHISDLKAQDDAFVQKASVEGITEYELSNGLKVLLFPDQSKPQVTVNVTYLVGSRHEAYGETGMAHLLEHLVFKGTPDHPDVAKGLKDHGAFYNGTTWFDRTNYFETLTATDENLEWALRMEADRMVNSFISGDDLSSEMTVVRNEYEMGENYPTGVLMKRVLGAAFQWHNYGKTTIGARADLENVPIERLQGFYKKYYQPDNAVLFVVGKFDEAQTKEWIAEYFGSIPRPERELIETYTREPVQDGEKFVTLKRVGDVQSLSALYHICAGSHPDYSALDVLNEIMTAEPAGRLYKALVDSKKTTNVWGWAAGLKEPGFLYIGADVLKEKSIDDAKETLTAALDTLLNKPFTPEELDRAKTSLLKEFDLMFNDSRQVGVLMSEFIAGGDWRYSFIYRDRIGEVSLEDVQRVAKYYLKPANRTVGVFIPDDAPDRVEIPEAPDNTELLANYIGRQEISKGEAFDPTPDNIEGRVMRNQATNAPDYAFLHKETRGDAVLAILSFKFGTKGNLKNKGMISQLTASMLNKGTTSMSRQQIQDQFDKLKTNARFSGSNGSVTVRLETENQFLGDAIELATDVVKNAVFPADEFEKLKDEELAYLEEQKSEPMAIAQRKIFKHLNPYPRDDVRYNFSFDEEVDAIKSTTIDEVKRFHKEFYGANNAVVTIVGDYDKDQIPLTLQNGLSEWKSGKPYSRLIPVAFPVETKEERIETPDKANASFFAGMIIEMNDQSPDYPAMVLANYIFGGGALSSRLGDRIRQKDGLSYGVGSFFNASSWAEKATWGAYAIYAPENGEALFKAFDEELNKALKEGFTQEELDAAKSGWLQSRKVARSQDNFLLSRLNSYLELDRSMLWDKALEEKIENLTVEDINKVFRKNIDPSKLSKIMAGDFAKSNLEP